MNHAYKSPGLWHEAPLDSYHGERVFVFTEIGNYLNGTTLRLDPTKKLAVIEKGKPSDVLSGPLDWFRKELQKPNLQWIEKQNTATGEVNVFRYSFKDEANKRNWSHDYWIDTKTKQVVEVHDPGADIYDPENDPFRKNPPGKGASGKGMGLVYHDIVFDADLDVRYSVLRRPRAMRLRFSNALNCQSRTSSLCSALWQLSTIRLFPIKIAPSSILPG